LSKAVRMDSNYYVIIPLEIPENKTIHLLLKNVGRWRVFTETGLNTAKYFRQYNLKKKHTAYINGKKLHLARLSGLVSQGGKTDFDMAAMMGQKCYLAIVMKDKKYKKARKQNWSYYVGYYAFNDEKELQNFRQKLHQLE